MSIRYRKSVRIAPGVKLNLNAQSVSITSGVRGAHVTYNSKGYRTTSVGIPGSGLSYRTTKRIAPSRASNPHNDKIIIGIAVGILAATILGAVLFIALFAMLVF